MSELLDASTERLRAFHLLPLEQQAAFWRALRDEIEAREASARGEVVAS